MKNTNTAAREAAQKPTTASQPNTARVSIATAERIHDLSDEHNQPPALIAGSLLNIGCNLADGDDLADAAGLPWAPIITKLIRKDLPEPKCLVPVLMTEWMREFSSEWATDMSRPIDAWLGQMIELGALYSRDQRVLSSLIHWEKAYFTASAVEIAEDNDDAKELLKPLPKAPRALVSFARHLVAGTGGAA